jgi:uncharacterized membrane protein YfcA
MPELWFALLLLGLFAGILSGLFGIGGGVVIVPLLTSFFGFGLQQAVGISLGALLMPVGILAVMAYWRAGELKVRIALPVAVGLLFGSWLSATLAFGIPVNTLRLSYGVFLIVLSWRFVEPRRLFGALRGHAHPPVPVEDERAVRAPLLVAVGFGAGVLSGLFGIGGGIVIVPALVVLLRMRQKTAIATSLGSLLLPVSLPAVLTYAQNNAFDLGTAAFIAVGLVFGAFGGARLTLRLPADRVKQLYGLFLLIIGLRFVLFTA